MEIAIQYLSLDQVLALAAAHAEVRAMAAPVSEEVEALSSAPTEPLPGAVTQTMTMRDAA